MHETNGVEFATVRLATDVTLHYAEQGDRAGEAVIFLHAYSRFVVILQPDAPLALG